MPLSLFAEADTVASGNLWYIDIAVFFCFLIVVLVIAFIMGGRDKKKAASAASEDYFLAGRGLAWWLIGISLISANISAEQFVGMPGQAARNIGLAIASYEWIAAVSLVIVAFIFLPRFLKAGVYTVPQFLETRYNRLCRTLMSLSLLAIYAFVTITAVNYAGAKAFSDIFGGQVYFGIELNLITFCWILGFFAAVYVLYGGLKSAAWAGSLQGTALILCGVIILFFALQKLGSVDKPVLESAMQALDFSAEKQKELLPKLENAGAYERFTTLNASKLRMNLPWKDTILPITALMFGIWIPNLYYWGLDQHIMQRTLGSRSLAQGQKGIVLAAFLKLIIPFIVIFPGLIAFNLYSVEMKQRAFEGKGGFEALKTEREKLGQLFDFDDKFASFYPEDAKKMITFNAEKTGVKAPEDLTDPLKALGEHKSQLVKANFGKQVSGYDYDSAFGLLLAKLVPKGGLYGFALAALFGMVISAMAAMLNAVSTLFSIDIYKEFFHRKASEKEIVLVGRISVVGFMILACCLVPILDNPKFGGIFNFIQEFQGFISPGILCAFMFGFFVHKAPRWSGTVSILLSPVIYGALMFLRPNTAFLDRMSITFCAIVIVLTLLRLLCPMKEPFKLETNTTMDLKTSQTAVVLGLVVVVITAFLYAYFWDYQTPMFDGFWESFR
ncbi:MAG: sodium/solute symporter [Planctomycetaceae bacterium]|jgi:SSS family solute:Na+ symporter|nr:sodium/solute symporter [Planctomycetaceae bacterium]